MKKKPFLFNKSSAATASKGRLVKSKRGEVESREVRTWKEMKKGRFTRSQATSAENEKGEEAASVDFFVTEIMALKKVE